MKEKKKEKERKRVECKPWEAAGKEKRGREGKNPKGGLARKKGYLYSGEKGGGERVHEPIESFEGGEGTVTGKNGRGGAVSQSQKKGRGNAQERASCPKGEMN